MEEASRVDRLEERVSALESAVEEVRDALLKRARLDRPAELRPEAVPAMPEHPGSPAPESVSVPARRRLVMGDGDLENWLGQNALLVVGVLALVAAVAFTLKYAFDQGWISPAARVGAGLIAGIVVAAYGERLLKRGLGRFGAALQGAGAAIAYLSTWAAAGPYQFVPAGVGIAALAVISGLVLLSALRNSEPYLASLAAAGAYLAPLLLGDAPDAGNLLLGYSAIVSAGAGAVAVQRGWRGTFLIVIVGFFLLSFVANPDLGLWSTYVALGGGVLLMAAREKEWPGPGLLAWLLAWSALWVGTTWIEDWRGWVLVVAPAALVWPVWRQAFDALGATRIRREPDEAWEILHTLVFYATALLWTAVATQALPAPADAYPLVVAAALALIFLVPGLLRVNAAMHLAGLGMLAVGIALQWDGYAAIAALAVLALLAAASTRSGPLAENRWTGLALVALASWELTRAETGLRTSDDPALIGRWAQMLYLVLASAVAIAGPLWKGTTRKWESPGGFDVRVMTWLLAAALAIGGGTVEIPDFVAQHGGSELAARLSVSAFWLVAAGGLLAYGFWKDARGVRLTGLAVAALAILKVVFVDLTELRALYRVGSLALLSLIALLAARAYHRREPDRGEAG